MGNLDLVGLDSKLESAIISGDGDRMAAATEAIVTAYPAIRAELTELRALLEMAQPFVAAQAGAEHMLEGFGKRQRRPIDALLERVNAAVLGAK